MEEKLNGEYFEGQAEGFNYNNLTGGADSASGGSGGSGMECLPLRSQSFHYLISEQAKSLVALQELQNEVGALLEFRDLVIETFPNLRSKMAPSRGNSVTRRDWEPGVRVRRKLPAPQESRPKPHPSVQDSGFSTETSCKEAHSSASASASASRSRPLEDELWALLDVIQRKGSRLREEAELLRGELDERVTAEDEFTHTISHPHCDCEHVQRLREERDALLERTAQLEAQVHSSSKLPTALGRLDATLGSPSRVPAPDSDKFAAILLESNPVELQRQLLNSTVQNQVLSERLKRVAAQRSSLFERLERARDVNEDLKFRLEEKSVELETTRVRVRQLEGCSHSSMREMEPVALPGEARSEPRSERRARPSRIPLHRGTASRPPSAHSQRSVKSAPPPRREPAPEPKSGSGAEWELAWEYVRRLARLEPHLNRLDHSDNHLGNHLSNQLDNHLSNQLDNRSLAHELLTADPDSIELWSGRPQSYFESMRYADDGGEFEF